MPEPFRLGESEKQLLRGLVSQMEAAIGRGARALAYAKVYSAAYQHAPVTMPEASRANGEAAIKSFHKALGEVL